jgi:hypothetical protein
LERKFHAERWKQVIELASFFRDTIFVTQPFLLAGALLSD